MHDAQERRVVVWRTGVLWGFGALGGLVSSCQIPGHISHHDGIAACSLAYAPQ